MRTPLLASVLVVAVLAAATASAKEMIPYERFTLPNGLRVIVHEDRKAPIVAVRVAYHVGSKNEPEGKTGFAHLYEHLLFRGTENFKGNSMQVLSNAGATGVNGVTSYDATEYFETVPTPALELALWFESERMGHVLPNITQQVLDSERRVVQNEKRQSESGPMGTVRDMIIGSVFPHGHPYHHSVIGSMDDLNAASLEDVRSWFTQYYGATNAVVVLAGDIDVATARPLMEKYFGDVPPGEPLRRMETWIPQLPSNLRQSMEARIGQAEGGIQWIWPIPAPGTRDFAMLNMASGMLTGTLEDRLQGELVEKRKLADGVSAQVQGFELAGIFIISVQPKPAADLAEIENIVGEQLALFVAKGPTRKELERRRSDIKAFRATGIQDVAARAELLARFEMQLGNPGGDELDTRWQETATAEDVRRVASQWLAKPSYQLTVRPFGDYAATPATFDRKLMPRVDNDHAIQFPAVQEATLANGMKVVLAELRGAANVSTVMVFENAGSVATLQGKRGVGDVAMRLMNAGPKTLGKAAYENRLQQLHATINVSSAQLDAFAGLSILKDDLRPALELWEQVLRHPAYRQADFDEWRTASLVGLASSTKDPGAVGARAMLKAIYPAGHLFAPPADEAAVIQAIELQDLAKYHAKWIRPDIAKLFVAGDITMPQLIKELEAVFGDWKAPAATVDAPRVIADAALPAKPRFILVDWPGEEQTSISARRFVLPASDEGSQVLTAAAAILGSDLSARLGRRLREEKGWSYGIGSSLDGAVIQQSWGFGTSVQADKTAESVAEILDVIEQLKGAQPATPEELARYVSGTSRSLAGGFKEPGAVTGEMVRSDAYGRPYDWIEGTAARLESLELDEVNRMAREYFTPQSLTWVLVGDLEKFEQKLRDLNVGSVEVWDRQGNKLR